MSSKSGSYWLTMVACLAVLAAAVLASSTASASTLYSIGGGVNWTDPAWSAVSGGSPTGTYNAAWVDGSEARFEGGSGTVHVGSVSLSGISFQPGYALSGGMITLTGGSSPFNSADYGFSVVNGIGIDGHSNSITINSTLAGTGGMEQLGMGEVVMDGASTYTGVTSIEGQLYYDSNSSIVMHITNGGNPYSQFVADMRYGSNPRTLGLNGLMKLDVASITDTAGSWTLVDSTNMGSITYGSYFEVTRADGTPFTNTGGVWTDKVGQQTWTFTQSTGVLGLTTSPEPGTLVLLATGLVGLLAYAWRKRR
jgi:autotransporter-associated beta strand protein